MQIRTAFANSLLIIYVNLYNDVVDFKSNQILTLFNVLRLFISIQKQLIAAPPSLPNSHFCIYTSNTVVEFFKNN